MGCIASKEDQIPPPTGQPEDPLAGTGDILAAIANNPHINYFKTQIENSLMPLARNGRMIKSKKDFVFATTDNKQYTSYIQVVNKSLEGNEIGTTNVLSYLFKEVADIRQRQQVQSKFKNQKYAALKCFVYLYTGDYAYKKVNQSLRKNQIQRLAPILSVIKKELRAFSSQNSSRRGRKIALLYRAIDRPDPMIREKARLFWKGFTSTAISKDVVKRFGEYQYTIGLKRELDHDYLIIPKQMSHYDEDQVLLFPFFFFEVTRINQAEEGHGANYTVIQMPPEGDKQKQIKTSQQKDKEVEGKQEEA